MLLMEQPKLCGDERRQDEDRSDDLDDRMSSTTQPPRRWCVVFASRVRRVSSGASRLHEQPLAV